MMNFYLGCKVVALTIYLFACIGDEVRCTCLPDGPTYDPSKEYDFPTYFPTAIDTKQLQFVKTTTPLRFDVAILERCRVENTGKSVMVQIEQKSKDAISGGILKDRYIYEKTQYYWVDRTDAGARAASTVDGKGEPLEIVFYWYNEKYCNFTNALNYRDGLVIGAIPIKLGPVPNPGFIFSTTYLAQIQKAGTSIQAEFGSTYLQYGSATPVIYYAYPGSYTDEVTGKNYFCATVITGPIIERPFISIAQFQGFLKLRNFAGGQLTNQAPLYSNPRLPKVQAFLGIVVPNVG